MINKGFELMDLRRAYWKRKDFYEYFGKGQLIFGDALYFRKVDVFVNDLLKINDVSFCISKIYKAVMCCLVFRLFDYAVSLVELCF